MALTAAALVEDIKRIWNKHVMDADAEIWDEMERRTKREHLDHRS